MKEISITRPWRSDLLAAALGIWLSTHAAADAPERSPSDEHPASPSCQETPHARPFHRTALFFGRSSPHGRVSHAQFQSFLDRTVTPLFPEGLTVLDARGQFRVEAQAAVQKEDSKMVILLYPFSPTASRDIDTIREAYKAQFAQRSVLRVDEPSCVSF